jgi:hypothetical protein
MPVSGEVPRFDISASPSPIASTVVSVAGAVSGAATGTHSTEAMPEFYRRALGLLTLSGTLSGVDQIVTASVVSGIRNLQQELALRIADAELGGGQTNALRLSLANGVLTASGEVQFGS